jgi:hypothetical protein
MSDQSKMDQSKSDQNRTGDRRPKPASTSVGDARERRLAAALRANLQRRKGAARPTPPADKANRDTPSD